MEWIDRILSWWIERSARKFGKGCARAMLFSFLVMKNKYEGVAPTYAWLAGRALGTRPYWIEENEWTFVFGRTGETVRITGDMSLLDVIRMVIGAEMSYNLSSLPPFQRAILTGLAQAQAEDYFRTKTS